MNNCKSVIVNHISSRKFCISDSCICDYRMVQVILDFYSVTSGNLNFHWQAYFLRHNCMKIHNQMTIILFPSLYFYIVKVGTTAKFSLIFDSSNYIVYDSIMIKKSHVIHGQVCILLHTFQPLLNSRIKCM